MTEEKNVQIVNPSGVPWAVRFKSLDAAWHRLLVLTGTRDTQDDRARMVKEGWRVRDLSSSSND